MYLLVSLAACSVEQEPSNLHYSTISPSNSVTDALADQGWNSETERIAAKCIEGNIEQSGSNQASIVFNSKITKEELFNSIGFSASAKAKSSIYSGNAAAQFAAANSEDSFSAVTIYSAQYKFTNTVFVPNAKLSEAGKSIAIANQADPNAWMRACGNEYIAQTKKGAQLIYSARIDFLSQEDKSEFNSEIGIGGPLTSISAKLEKTAQKFKDKAVISISAFQQGGDTSQLSRAFDFKSESNEIQLIRCSMASIEPCLKTLESLVRYASSEDGFPGQIKNNGANGRAADIQYLTMPYDTAGIFVGKDLLIRRIIANQREDIESKLEENIFIKNRKDFFDKLEIGAVKDLGLIREELKKIYAKNQDLISKAVTACYDELYLEDTSIKDMRDSCTARVYDLNDQFESLPRELIEQVEAICPVGYQKTDSGCQALRCESGYLFGESWTSDLKDQSGQATYTCNSDGIEELESVSCNASTHFQPKDNFGRAILACLPKPCYENGQTIEHGNTWRVKIPFGENLMQCSYGEFIQLATICEASYKLVDGICKDDKEISYCKAPNGSQVKEKMASIKKKPVTTIIEKKKTISYLRTYTDVNTTVRVTNYSLRKPHQRSLDAVVRTGITYIRFIFLNYRRIYNEIPYSSYHEPWPNLLRKQSSKIQPSKEKPRDSYYAGNCDLDYTSFNQDMYDKYPIKFTNYSGIEQIQITHLNEILSLPESFLEIAIQEDFQIFMAKKLSDMEPTKDIEASIAGVAGGGRAYLNDGKGASSVAIHELMHLIEDAPKASFQDPRFTAIFEQIKSSKLDQETKDYYTARGYREFLAQVSERFYCFKSYKDWLKEEIPELHDYMVYEFEDELVRQYEASHTF